MPESGCKLADVPSLMCTCGESRLGKTLSLGCLSCLYYYCLGMAPPNAWSLCPQPRGGIILVRDYTLGAGGSRDPPFGAVWTWSTWSLGGWTEGRCPYCQSPVSKGERPR